MPTKLNSMRLLESHRVSYDVLTYEYDPDNPADASDVARQIGMAPARVFKTLVVQGADQSRPLLIMLAADRQLDLKRAAAAIGLKRLELVPRVETERLSGLKIGGIGALALAAKHWPSYLARSAEQFEQIYVNAGQRGIMLGVAVTDLLRVLDARVIDVT
jgi:Cys-tRNA(Pro)/Cys-tRNA(Cys) deacylase